jgi:hypothetical protein
VRFAGPPRLCSRISISVGNGTSLALANRWVMSQLPGIPLAAPRPKSAVQRRRRVRLVALDPSDFRGFRRVLFPNLFPIRLTRTGRRFERRPSCSTPLADTDDQVRSSAARRATRPRLRARLGRLRVQHLPNGERNGLTTPRAEAERAQGGAADCSEKPRHRPHRASDPDHARHRARQWCPTHPAAGSAPDGPIGMAEFGVARPPGWGWTRWIGPPHAAPRDIRSRRQTPLSSAWREGQ